MKVLVSKLGSFQWKKLPTSCSFYHLFELPLFLQPTKAKHNVAATYSLPFVSAKSQEAIECVVNDVLAYSSALLNCIQWLDLGFSNLRIKASAHSYLLYCWTPARVCFASHDSRFKGIKRWKKCSCMRNSWGKKETVNEREIFSRVFKDGRLSALRAHEQPTEASCKLPFKSLSFPLPDWAGGKGVWSCCGRGYEEDLGTSETEHILAGRDRMLLWL